MVKSFWPQTRRQWAATVVALLTVAFSVWSASVAHYKYQLQQFEEREWRFWSAVARNSSSAVIVVDCETGRVIGWNRSAQRILGWRADEVSGSRFTFLVSQEYIGEKYGHSDRYWEKITSAETYLTMLGTVKELTGFVNTKSGKPVECKITIRTVGSSRFAYVAQLDPVTRVDVLPPVPVDPPTTPIEDPMPAPATAEQLKGKP